MNLPKTASDIGKTAMQDVPIGTEVANLINELSDFKHCDDYIDDVTQPQALRAFLDYARSPAHGALLDRPKPKLFADYKGKRVRVVMASRFGDVGITSKLHEAYGYERRVDVAALSNFSDAKAKP